MESQERAHKLLNLLLESDIREETKAGIRVWLSDPDGWPEKDIAMRDSFFRMVNEEKPNVRAHALFHKIAVVLGMEEPYAAELPPATRSSRKDPNAVHRRTWWIVAAVIVPLFMISGYFTFRYLSQPIRMIDVAVADGDAIPVYVELPDGTEVWLNKETRFSYPEKFLFRRNTSLDGEAYFAVKSNGRPFMVETHNMDVSVRGTEFNIRSAEGDETADIRLTSGKVAVVAEESTVELEPLQQLVLNTASGDVEVSEFDPDDIDDWRVSVIKFENTPLHKIVRRIGLYYKVAIEIDEAMDPDNRIRMMFDKKSGLEDALFALQKASPEEFDYEITEGKVVLNKK